MNYLSLSFAAFVLVSVLLSYILPAKLRWCVLLSSSLIFYACFDLRYLAFLLTTALSTYVCARLLPRSPSKKWSVGGCVALNAGIWFAIKELPWLLSTSVRALDLLGIPLDAPALSFIVPVGLSYFTLQAIAYLVDVAKGKVTPERNFLHYLLFLSWFPSIVQGPISRYDQLMPQLVKARKASYDGMRRGLLLILFGLVKKNGDRRPAWDPVEPLLR